MLCLPLGSIGQFRVAGFPLSLAKMVALALLAALVAEAVQQRVRPDPARARSWFADLDLGGQAAVVGVAALATGLVLRPDVTVGDPVPFLQVASGMALVPMVALSWPRLSRHRRQTLALVLAGLTLLLMVVTVGRTVEFNYYGDRITRFGGTLSDPNDWAGVLLAVLTIVWAQATDLADRARRWAAAGLGGGLVLALLLTQSRGGLIAAVAMVAAYAGLACGRRGRLVLLASTLVALGLFLGLRAVEGGPFGDSVAVRRILILPGEGQTEIVDVSSITRRFDLAEDSGDAFLDRPLTGHGAGTYAEVTDYRLPSGKLIEGHNIVSVAAVEYGVLGLAGTLVLAVPGLFWMARGPTVISRRLAAGFFGLWVVAMSINLLDNTYLWMVLGVLWAETDPGRAQGARART